MALDELLGDFHLDAERDEVLEVFAGFGRFGFAAAVAGKARGVDRHRRFDLAQRDMGEPHIELRLAVGAAG